MVRRQFLKDFSVTGAGLLVPASLFSTGAFLSDCQHGGELSCDILIIGGGLGGCAAALAACDHGSTVIMTEPTGWIGGQLTQQGVPPDEHQWIEDFGRTEKYAHFRYLVRQYYRKNYALSQAAKSAEFLNPGNGSVSRICHEPLAALSVLQNMLAPAISRGKLRIFLNSRPVLVHTEGDLIQAVICLNENTGKQMNLVAGKYIDASEEGDLLALSGAEYVIGFESQDQTGEPHAPEKADPENIQALTWCLAIDHMEGQDHTIERPEMYDFWRDHIPELNPPWPGKLLSLRYSDPRTLEPRNLAFIPPSSLTPEPHTEDLNLWLYRRMIDRGNFVPGTFESDITLINWPQNDYMLGNITDVSEEARRLNLFRARQLSLSLLYWLQTEAPGPDGKEGWSGLRLRADIFGTEDGLAPYPYIRESRRIKAELTIKEQDLSREIRENLNRDRRTPVLAAPFPDSVGIGYYHLDLHPSTGGDNYIDMASVPFQIPLGAMIPVRMENLLPGCKNIGTTHISNGCYRLHPVEWSVGEAAGHLAAYSLRKGLTPRAVRNTDRYLEDFQSLLIKSGIELEWDKLK